MVINGKEIAEKIYEECRDADCGGRFLAVFYSELNPAVESFIKQKKIAARRLGIEVLDMPLDKEGLRKAASDPLCGGIVLQLPLVDRTQEEEYIALIPSQKDVDCLLGGKSVPSPTVAVVEEVLAHVKEYLFGTISLVEIAVIGKGKLVGGPVLEWARGAGAEKVNSYDKGFDPRDLQTADLIISGAGEAGIFSREHLKRGAVVIDFGYARNNDGKLSGDFNSSGADAKGIIYTPTPGGTGPVLVACLMRNFCILNKKT